MSLSDASSGSIKADASTSLDATEVSVFSSACAPRETPRQSNRTGVYVGKVGECRQGGGEERRRPPSPSFDAPDLPDLWREKEEEEGQAPPASSASHRTRAEADTAAWTSGRRSRPQERQPREPAHPRSSGKESPRRQPQRQRQPSHFLFWTPSIDSLPLFSHSALAATVLLLAASGLVPVAPFRGAVDAYCSLLIRTPLLVTALLALLHRSGALRRFALRLAERELKKALNGADATLSDLRLDLFGGRIIAQDLVLHNRDRDLWRWDSPCLARVGRIEATLNFASVIVLPRVHGLWPGGPIFGHAFKDVYTVLVEDVQVFVEKRGNVLNFHLLDPSLDIPDHGTIMDEYLSCVSAGGGDRASSPSSVGSQPWGGADKPVSASRGCDAGSESIIDERLDASRRKIRNDDASETGSCERDDEDASNPEAERIVGHLVGAMSNLGKAANEGGTRALQSALRDHRAGWVKTLKQLQDAHSSVDASNPSVGLAEGMSVMRRLGKVVEQNVTNIKESVATLQKPPPKKHGWVERKPEDIRIGSVMARELRIFTKDILVLNSKKQTNGAGSDGPEGRQHNGSGGSGLDSADSTTSEGWTRPIVIRELAITGAELSPLMSARDPQTGLPVVGIPVKRLLDVILTKLLTEMAKSSSGRLFQTALGDVFSLMNLGAVGGSRNGSVGSPENKNALLQ